MLQFYSWIFVLFSFLTIGNSQEFDVLKNQFQNTLNSELNSISNPLNNGQQKNVQGYHQSENKNNHKEENIDEDAKLLINKIEKLVVEYQKLKQVQDNLLKKVSELEKSVTSSKRSKSKENILNPPQNIHGTDVLMKQRKTSDGISSQHFQNPQNWQDNSNPSPYGANMNQQQDFGNHIQNPKGFTQNSRRSNLLINPIQEAGNFLTRQTIIPQNPINDIYNRQNFAQTQNIVGRGIQKLPYYGNQFYETQIQNPLQYPTYFFRQ